MNIAIITGGTTGERLVSIKSANNIKENINFADVDTYLFPEDRTSFFENIDKYACIIPMIHGVGGEDGVLQKELNKLGIKYLFSDYAGHSLCFDKNICKNELNKYDVLSPKTVKVDNIKVSDFPLIYKKIDGGSSIGIKLIESENDLLNINDSAGFILEQYISGREFTVGVVDDIDGVAKALPVVEISSEGLFFDESQKYSDHTDEIEICPAHIDRELEDKLKKIALTVHMSLDLKHMSRSDFILDNNGDVYFLEVNTIPGMTSKSLIIKELNAEGYNIGELFKFWCK